MKYPEGMTAIEKAALQKVFLLQQYQIAFGGGRGEIK